jgi:hypothetical protein
MMRPEFQVVLDGTPGADPAWAHLVANGAEVTLCCEPTASFVPAVGAPSVDLDGSLCWVCRATATVP